MTKTVLLGVALGAALVTGVMARDAPPPTQDLPQYGGAGVRAGHITSTGETVPNPGVSQSGGTTSLDLGVQQEDNKIQGSICKGC